MEGVEIRIRGEWGEAVISEPRLSDGEKPELEVRVRLRTPEGEPVRLFGQEAFWAGVEFPEEGEAIVRFRLPVFLGGRKASGLRLDPESTARLREAFEALRREREALRAAWAAYVPEWVLVAQGGDTWRWYVWPDRDPPPGAGRNSTCQRLEELLERAAQARRPLHAELERIGEVSPPPRGFYAFGNRAYRVSREALEDLLRPEGEAQARQEAERRAAAEALAARVREREGQGGAVVAIVRCWECGRGRIVGRIDEAGRVVPMPPDLARRAEEALTRARRRSAARSRGEILATVGIDPDPALPFDFQVVGEEYCGC